MSKIQKNKQGKSGKASYGLPFNLARYFTWLTLLIVMVVSASLAFFIGSQTTDTLMRSQREYASLLAANLNTQLFRNFIAPRMLALQQGVQFTQDEQYMMMDEIIRMFSPGLQFESIYIFDDTYTVTYAIDEAQLNRSDLHSAAVPSVFEDGQPRFELVAAMTNLQALLTTELLPDTYILETTVPLTLDMNYVPALETVLGPFDADPGLIMGVLQIKQDVTQYYATAMSFQRLIIMVFLGACLFLFILIQVMVRQAERILSERVQRNMELEADLHQSEKLASMGRMVASIAHEIRNPLGIIRSSAELLLKRNASTDKTSTAILGAIYDESCRLGVTVNDFLDYARPKQAKTGIVDLTALLVKAEGFLQGEMSKHQIELRLNLQDNLHILGDADLLYRAFYNVLINGQQAIGQKGVISVQGFRDSGNLVIVQFADSGPGFSDEVLDNVLDPFFTTKDSGTGLGLPIVHSITAVHQGKLELGNTPDGGALVKMIFPACELRIKAKQDE